MGDRASLSHIFFDRLQEGIRKLTGFDFRFSPPSLHLASFAAARSLSSARRRRSFLPSFGHNQGLSQCPYASGRGGLLGEGVKRIKFGSHPQIGTQKGKEGEQEQSSAQMYGQEQCFLRQLFLVNFCTFGQRKHMAGLRA